MKEIKSVIDLMTKHGLSEFELEKEDFKIRVKRGAGDHAPSVAAAPMIAMPAPAPAPAPSPAMSVPSAASAPTPAADTLPTINSPMVGTLYLQSSPGSPSFVEIGSEVTEDTVVCIIEAMKVMNEIKAEMRGTIVEVLGDNGKPVEFGRPLFKVRPR